MDRHPLIRSAVLAAALAVMGATVPVTASAQTGADPSAEPEITIHDRIEVRRTLLEVRVVDGMGRPVEGLAPEDFTVRLGGRPARVEAVDRVVADGYARSLAATAASPLEDAGRAGTAAAFDPAVAEPRQLVVLFFQTSLLPSKIVGFLRVHRHLDEMIDALPADVAAAVVAFDSHLKLHQDFTTDRAALKAAVERSFGYTPAAFPAVPPAAVPSLAHRIEERQARRVARAEDALAMVAVALEPLPGEKAMVYVGWGLGRLDAGTISMGRRYEDARAALVRARVPAFVLDVTDADFHSLETTLMAFADETGGQFFRTHEFPGREVTRIEHTLGGGRYLLLVEAPDLEPGWHDLRVRTRERWSFQRVLAPAQVQVRPQVAAAPAPGGGGGAAAGAAL
jgi:VWFA-related protein